MEGESFGQNSKLLQCHFSINKAWIHGIYKMMIFIYPANLGKIDWMDNIWMIRVTVENWIPVIQDGARFWLLHFTFVYNSILPFTSVPNTKKCIYDRRNCNYLFPKFLSHRSFYSRKKNNSSKTFSNSALFHMLQRPDLSSLVSFLFLFFGKWSPTL